MNNGIEKLQKYAFGMKPRLCDDILVLADQIQREHVSELQAIEERYKTDIRDAREARDIAIKEASKLRNDVNLAKDLVHDFRSDIAIMLDISCDVMDDEVQDAIKAELDKRLMPHGMEWLRYEDGVFVLPSDKGIIGIEYSKTGNTVIVTSNDDEPRVVYAKGERVKRPESEVLGADGLPIKVGDTVYSKSVAGYVVSEVYRRESKGFVEFVGEPKRGWVAAYLTHTPPDTQEQIDEDAIMDAGKYVAGHPEAAGLREPPGFLSAKQAMMADLLRRQRELDARTIGGAK